MDNTERSTQKAAVVVVRNPPPKLGCTSKTNYEEKFPQRSSTGFDFEIRSVPIPELKPWEVLVKLSATGVCGTDISLAAGHVGPTCDILGHEGVGRVVRLGSGVDPDTVKVGDRVGIAWVRDVCGRCPCCRAGWRDSVPRTTQLGAQVRRDVCRVLRCAKLISSHHPQ